jgi:hypothetical protein
MSKNKERPIPESQSVTSGSSQREKGPDDKSGTKSMHDIPPIPQPVEQPSDPTYTPNTPNNPIPGDDTSRVTRPKGSGS